MTLPLAKAMPVHVHHLLARLGKGLAHPHLLNRVCFPAGQVCDAEAVEHVRVDSRRPTIWMLWTTSAGDCRRIQTPLPIRIPSRQHITLL